MLFNAKNVQFDTEKIQEAIRNAEKLQGDFGKVVKGGMGGIPVKASIYLANISIPYNDEDFKNFLSTSKAVGKVKVNQDLQVRPRIECTIQCDVESNLRTSFNTSEVKKIYLTELGLTITAIDDSFEELFADELGEEKPSDSEQEHTNRIRNLASEIEKEYFGIGWALTLTATHNIKSYLTLDLYTKIEEALIHIKDRLSKSIIKAPRIQFEAVENVIALNLIKLVEKGTDNISNLYSGKSRGIVIEALVDSKYNKFNRVSILKTLDEVVHTYSNRDLGMYGDAIVENEIMALSHIVTVDTIACIMCTHYITMPFYSMESMSTLAATKQAADSKLAEQVEKIKSKVESREPINCVEYRDTAISIFKQRMGNEICIEYEGFTRLDSAFNNEELIKLLVPVGKDLSNSFKAKYI